MKTVLCVCAAIAACVFAIAWAAGAPLDLAGALGLLVANAPLAATMPKEEFDRLLAELKTAALKLEGSSKEIEKIRDENRELKQRQIDLEQKFSQRPGGATGPLDGSGAGGTAAIVEAIEKSPQFEALRRGESKWARIPLPKGARLLESKAIVTPSDAGVLSAAERLPMVTPAMRRMTIRDLLPSSGTGANTVEYPVLDTFTNNAAIVFSSPGDRENVTKPESQMVFSLATARVETIAHFIKASKQVLDDSPGLKDVIDRELVYGLKLEEEAEMLLGDGSAGHFNGLDTAASAYNRGVSNDSMLDCLLKAILQLSLSEFEATGIVLNPVDWTTIALLKDTQGRYLFSDPQAMTTPRLWGRPVVPTNSMTSGRFLVGAFDQAAEIRDRETAVVEIGYVDDDFVKNMITIRCEERLALPIRRSTALVRGSLPALGT